MLKLKKLWEKEWIKMLTPIYGELYIMRQETDGHAYGYEKGFILLIFGWGKYGSLALIAAAISNLWK